MRYKISGTLFLVILNTQVFANIEQFNITNPKDKISQNTLAKYNIDKSGIVINNSPYNEDLGELGVTNSNKELTQTAKTILIKITGPDRSILKGPIVIAGPKAHLVLINPNGITCDGCSFTNIIDVELRTAKTKDILITNNGTNINNGSLFLNSGKIKIEGQVEVNNNLKMKAENLVNDNGANISANKIYFYLTGKQDALRHNGDSVLQSREGIDVTAPNGNIYFGYKTEITGLGDNKDGFKFVGSKLISNSGTINIQSGGNVTFEGAQVFGKIQVQAAGEIRKLNLLIDNAYKDGFYNEVVNKTMWRDILKPIDVVKKVFDHHEQWCRFLPFFGSCIGPQWNRDIYRDTHYIELVPDKESYINQEIIIHDKLAKVALDSSFTDQTFFAANQNNINFKSELDILEDFTLNFNYNTESADTESTNYEYSL